MPRIRKWNHVSDRKLGPRDLSNVLRALTNIQYKWEFLAIQFGLPRRIIETARNNYPRDPNGCLMYVLEQWLEGNYDTEQFCHPSWRRVCEVTAEPAGGDNRALALKIATADVRFIEPEAAVTVNSTERMQIMGIRSFVSISVLCALLFAILALSLPVFLPQTINHPSLPEPLELYQGYLRDTYLQHTYSIYTKPTEVLAPNRPKQPLNLVMVPRAKNEADRSFMRQHKSAFKGNVNEIQNQKRTIEIEEIGLIPGEKPVAHFVLIEGAPGIGKSTLCWQLCRLWAEGKLQHKWDLMVLVEIRHKAMRKAQSVYDLLYYPDDTTIRESIAREVQKQKGEGLLLIFDGYDELSKDQRSELSVFQQILTNRLLSNATIIVSSRPMATASLPSRFIQDLDQHIAIAGFDKDSIHTYIRSACGDNGNLSEDFHTYVSSRPFIFSVMYNPLHCTIVTELYIQYWQDGQKGFAPNTLTELYTSLVLNLIRRNSACNDLYMSDLPAHVNNSLMQLAELAAGGLKEKNYIFSNVPNDTLGLMVPVRQIYNIRTTQPVYMFLHLTLQEYLSALYWSQQTQQQLRDDFLKKGNILSRMDKCVGFAFQNYYNGEDNDYCESVHWPHLLFLAGLTKLSHPFSLELIPKKENLSADYVGSLCQLSFEAQSSQILSTILSSRKVDLKFHLYDDFYLFLIGYCIANSDNTTIWVIMQNHESIMYSTENEIYVFNTTTSCRTYSSISDGLHYSLNTTDWNARPSQPSVHMEIPVECLQSVPKIHLITSITSELFFPLYVRLHFGANVSHFFPRLVSLQLDLYTDFNYNLTDLPQLIPQSLVSIKGLSLPNYNVLLDNIHEYPALEDLEIYYINSHRDKFCQSLKRNLPKLAGKLKSLTLIDVQINYHCLDGIVHLLNSSLNYLHQSDCRMSSTDFDHLTTAIATSKLKHFKMTIWSISSVGGESLAKLLRQSKTLDQVTVSTKWCYQLEQCNVIRLLIKAMTHSSVKKLELRTRYNCDFSDIPYDRDKVKISHDP